MVRTGNSGAGRQRWADPWGSLASQLSLLNKYHAIKRLSRKEGKKGGGRERKGEERKERGGEESEGRKKERKERGEWHLIYDT